MRDEEIQTLLKENDTAFYVFDIGELKSRISWLRTKFPMDTKLCYAVKANPFVAGEIKDDVDRYEICSPGEYRICKRIGIPAEKMVISGVYKTPSFIEELVKDDLFNGIFTAESENQYELLCSLSRTYGRSVSVLLRLTNGSQFGMDEKVVERIIRNRGSHPSVELVGLQYFSGTQKTSIKKYRRELGYLDSFIERMQTQHGFSGRELEYGTGFPVAYFKDNEIDEEMLFKEISEMIKSMKYSGEVILEIGRSLVASCGRYFTHIVDVKHNMGQNYILTDGGMHHLTYYGQSMAIRHPYLSIVGKESMENETSWIICGSLCSMNDIIVKEVDLPDIEIGDVICFKLTGAYSMTEGISLFLSRDIPAVYIKKSDGTIYCVRTKFETDTLNTPNYDRRI